MAEPSSISRLAPSGRSTPDTVAGAFVLRFQANTGVDVRSISSTAVGISSGSLHSSVQRSGCASSSLSPSPSSDVVVSCPANSWVWISPAISSFEIDWSPSR